MLQEDSSGKVWQATVDKSGRILLPAELRHMIDANAGSSLLWIKDANGIHLKRFEDSLADFQAYYQQLAPTEIVWSDELLKQRTTEASND